MRKKLISIMLGLAMVLTMISIVGSVAYAEGEKTQAPTNVRWEDKTAKWDNPNDSSIRCTSWVYLYNTKDSDYVDWVNTDVGQNEWNFSGSLIPGDTYYFKVSLNSADGDTEEITSSNYTVPGSYTIPSISNLQLSETGKMTWTETKYEDHLEAILYVKNGSEWNQVASYDYIVWGDTSYTWSYSFEAGKTYRASLVGKQGNIPVTEVTYTNEYTKPGVSGSCGTSVNWELNGTELVISGSGAMTDFASAEVVPWKEFIRNIKTLVVEEGVTKIGNYAFADNYFSSITLPNSLQAIGTSAFYSYHATAKELTIPDNVETLSHSCIKMFSLETVNLGSKSKLYDDGGYDFYNMTKVTNISVPSDNPYYSAVDGVLFDKDKKTLIAYPEGRTGNYTVPEGVIEIDEYAFANSKIAEITLNNGLDTIKASAFSCCSNLTAISIPDSVHEIGGEAFIACSNVKSISIGAGVNSVEDGIFAEIHADRISLSPDNTLFTIEKGGLFCDTKIDSSTTYNTMHLYVPMEGQRAYVVPEGTENITRGVFEGNENLKYIVLPESLQRIEGRIIPYSKVEKIYFSEVPAAHNEYSNYLFDGATSLTDIYYEGTNWNTSVLGANTTNELPAGVTIHNNHVHTAPLADCECVAGGGLIDAGTLEVSIDSATGKYEYTGEDIKPVVTAKDGAELLTEKVDYYVTYPTDVKNAGDHNIQIDFYGKYNGQVIKTYTITPISISGKTVTLSDEKVSYTGSELKPTVTVEDLKEDVDFEVSYSNNINVGTATVTITGIGNYKDTITKTFEIEENQIDIATLPWISFEGSFPYTGSAIEPEVWRFLDELPDGFIRGKAWTSTYSNNVNPGTATLTITGIGDYTGIKVIEFTIVKEKVAIIKLSASSYVYSGTAKNPSVTVITEHAQTLAKGKTASYSDKNVKITYPTGRKKVGSYTIKATGRGGYTGTITKTFKINPKKAVISRATVGSKKITVKMSTKVASTGGSNYQIAYRQKGTSKWKTTTTTSQTKTISELKKGKKYEIKVRAYKKVDGKTYYGAYSAVKTSAAVK